MVLERNTPVINMTATFLRNFGYTRVPKYESLKVRHDLG